MPHPVRKNGSSRQATTSNIRRMAGGLVLIRIAATGIVKMNSMINPNTLIVQGNPILGWSLWKTIGKTTPPIQISSASRFGIFPRK